MSHTSPAPHILESTTQKVLHAQGFSRSSSHAALVLSDLLARYFILLLGAAGRRAEHAGRTNMAAADAVAALTDMGVGVEELEEYFKSEGVEMVRYTGVSQRRAEEIREWGVQLADGLPPKEEGVPLFWAPVNEDMLERVQMEGDEEEYEDDAASAEEDNMDTTADAPPPPLLSLYPFRSTTPDHLPPLPKLSPDGIPISDEQLIAADGAATADTTMLIDTSTTPPTRAPSVSVQIPPPSQAPSRGASTSPSRAALSLAATHIHDNDNRRSQSPHHPDAPGPSQSPIKREPTPSAQLPTLASASTSSGADYASQIPYTQSVLASAPEWHLPAPPPPHANGSSHSHFNPNPIPKVPHRRLTSTATAPPPTPGGSGALAPNGTPSTQPALFAAYHHILTHPSSSSSFMSFANSGSGSGSGAGGSGAGAGGAGGVGSGAGAGGAGGAGGYTAPSPARHRVALSLLAQMHARPRWSAPDSLFASDAGAAVPCLPRTGGAGPVFAVRIGRDGRDVFEDEFVPAGKDGKDGKEGGKEGKEGKDGRDGKKPLFPGPAPRPVLGREGASFAPSVQGSRVPELARAVLPTNVYTRTTRLAPPPPLARGTQKLYYGPGVPAPWNGSSSSSSSLPPSSGPNASTPHPSAPNGDIVKKERMEDGDKKHGAPGGAGAGGAGPAVSLPDATLYATWEYDVKRASEALVVPPGAGVVVGAGGAGGRRRR